VAAQAGGRGGKQPKGDGRQQPAKQPEPPSAPKDSNQRTIGSFFAAKGGR
jgi:hypothetical protein